MRIIQFILLFLLIFSCNTKPDINNLNYWTYEVNYEVEERDSVNPIGRIFFSRTKSIKDELREDIYDESWYPSMSFEIYNISDLNYCEEVSNKMRTFSSCMNAHLGGDLIINKKYVFYNNSGCLNCVDSENEIDFCRPVTNKILIELNLSDNSTLDDLEREIQKKVKRVKERRR